MPRKSKMAISGLQDVVHEVNDVSFVAVDHPRAPGWNQKESRSAHAVDP
jgi:sulfite reductase (ferredoxin)